jgi:hypothetical protein
MIHELSTVPDFYGSPLTDKPSGSTDAGITGTDQHTINNAMHESEVPTNQNASYFERKKEGRKKKGEKGKCRTEMKVREALRKGWDHPLGWGLR